MLSPWLELDGAADQLALWSKASGLDLVRLGTTASTEEITDTAVTQPLVVAATLLAHQELTRRGLLADADLVVAGHSVGEIAAYAIAGVMAADGAEMAKACAVEPTGMSAVLGGDEAEVLARLEQLDLFPANRNAAGQIVAAGSLAALEKLAEDPPGPGCAPSGWPERSTPSTWPRRSTATPPRRPPSRRPSRCCPTATASRSPRRPRRWRRWSPS